MSKSIPNSVWFYLASNAEIITATVQWNTSLKMKRRIAVGTWNINVHTAIKMCSICHTSWGKWDGPGISSTANRWGHLSVLSQHPSTRLMVWVSQPLLNQPPRLPYLQRSTKKKDPQRVGKWIMQPAANMLPRSVTSSKDSTKITPSNVLLGLNSPHAASNEKRPTQPQQPPCSQQWYSH